MEAGRGDPVEALGDGRPAKEEAVVCEDKRGEEGLGGGCVRDETEAFSARVAPERAGGGDGVGDGRR